MGRAVGREHAAVLGAAIPTPGARVRTFRSWLAVAPVYNGAFRIISRKAG